MSNFQGAPYPIVRNPRGLLATQNDINQIKSDLLCLLLTNPGERVMLPNFGTPLRKLLFEPNDAILVAQARQLIIAAIQAGEPRIAVTQIDIFAGGDPATMNPQDSTTESNSILTIRIMFVDPNNIKNVQNLTLELPLASEGAST